VAMKPADAILAGNPILLKGILLTEAPIPTAAIPEPAINAT